ncbi:MAG: type II CRISPR-associated endonuclease Cas1, partial [Alphaproteobacteria bacterium]|nr:type II CRISPR-associated endonuclease Cas1 [Alphaproteobacteria bacterium]
MSWRSLVITNPSRLSREHGSLVVEQGEGRDRSKVTIPFEDIALILLDQREISLTHSVLSSCGEFGIVLISTGATHHPNGAFLPYLPHSHQGKWLQLQMGLSRVVAKQLWSRIVAAKIANQAACLRLAEREGEERLLKLIPQIKAGDGGNIEATAAHLYFRYLFGETFTRSQEVFANAAMNYGYAVVRAAIARGLVAHGLLPTLGLFHASQQNAYNLADDLIEPFRPLVDLHV